MILTYNWKIKSMKVTNSNDLTNVVGGGYKSHVDGQIRKQINAKKNSIREVSQLPWEPVPPTPPTP